MSQKYKFFVRDKAVILEQKRLNDEHLSNQLKTENDEAVERKLEQIFDRMELENDMIFSAFYPDRMLSNLSVKFEVIEAGGGYVLNDTGQLLLIYRLGCWDLPKGKLERGESARVAAIREVEEECGIGNIEALEKETTSYHLYSNKGQTIIKKTYWFEMRSNWTKALIPQIEEGIEKVEWVNLPLMDRYTDNMYASIKDVIHYFS